MFPLTLDGLNRAVDCLRRGTAPTRPASIDVRGGAGPAGRGCAHARSDRIHRRRRAALDPSRPRARSEQESRALGRHASAALNCRPSRHPFLPEDGPHPTGSLKHRLARSLFLYALCNGRLRPATVVDASRQYTAISEAWFARLLLAALRRGDAAPHRPRARSATCAPGRQCDLVDDAAAATRGRRPPPRAPAPRPVRLAERATDWRGNNNIANRSSASLARTRSRSRRGSSAGAPAVTRPPIGRYLRYRRLPTRLCVAEFMAAPSKAGSGGTTGACARATTPIEGIGRPRAEPGFVRDVVDSVIGRPTPIPAPRPGCWRTARPPLRRLVRHQPRRLPAPGRGDAAPRRVRRRLTCYAIAATATPKPCSTPAWLQPTASTCPRRWRAGAPSDGQHRPARLEPRRSVVTAATRAAGQRPPQSSARHTRLRPPCLVQ